MSKYVELLKELQNGQATLAKALPAAGDGDDKIVAAASEGGASQELKTEGDDEKKLEGEGEGVIAKSLQVTLADGSSAEAFDATDLIKSLQDQVKGLHEKAESTETTLSKALDDTLELLKGQAALIKSLSERVVKLGGTGGGRKAVVTVHDKPTGEEAIVKSQGAGELSMGDFMLKANEAFKSKALTGLELNSIDVAMRSRQQIDPDIVRKVLGAK